MQNKQLPNIVILTGAGISAESGIATFRASDGLWEKHKIEDVATPSGFKRNPELVQNFYNQRRQELQQPTIKPNAAHIAIAELEQLYIAKHQAERFLLVTQNIDNLHQQAGSQRIIAMHGELLKVRCCNSNKVYAWQHDLTIQDRCSCCSTPAPLRPHIVWFEEMPIGMQTIYQALQLTNYFIAIGTSGNVYPAAGFVQEANAYNAITIELNLEPSNTTTSFQDKHYGKASIVVPKFLQQLITEFQID